MGKKVWSILIITLVLALGTAGASETAIQLGGSNGSSFNFIGTDGGVIDVQLGTCSGGSCILTQGSANGTLVGTLHINGGSMANGFGASSGDIDLHVSTSGNLSSLVGSNGTLSGAVSFTSQVTPSLGGSEVAPEPTSIFLVGTGLIVL